MSNNTRNTIKQRRQFVTQLLARLGAASLLPVMLSHRPALAQTTTKPRLPVNAMNLNTKTWKTLCMGRFMMKVPPDAKTGGGFSMRGERLELRKDLTSMALLNQEVAAKQNAFKKEKHVDFGTRYIETYNLNNKGLSVWGFEDGEANFINGRHERVTHNYFYSTNPFRVWYVKVDVSPSGIDDEKQYLLDLANQIRPLAEGEVPTEYGFVIEGGIVRSDVWRGETMGGFFSPPFFMNPFSPTSNLVHFTFDSLAQGVFDPKTEPKLLNRMSLAQKALLAITGTRILRQRDRALNGIEGQEYLMRQRSTDDRWTGYLFRWEAQGTAQNNYDPRIGIDMSVNMPNTDEFPPPPFKTDEEALAFWDTVLNTFKLRPVTTRDGRQISDSGSIEMPPTCRSGEICPKTGVYEASISPDHPDAFSVSQSRGRWVYMQAGQPMISYGMYPFSEEVHIVWTWIRENRT